MCVLKCDTKLSEIIVYDDVEKNAVSGSRKWNRRFHIIRVESVHFRPDEKRFNRRCVSSVDIWLGYIRAAKWRIQLLIFLPRVTETFKKGRITFRPAFSLVYTSCRIWRIYRTTRARTFRAASVQVFVYFVTILCIRSPNARASGLCSENHAPVPR